MKVLITGATGFVGANVAARFVKEGHEVHATVRKSANWRLEKIKDEIHLHDADLRDFAAVCAAMEKIRPDAVIHMATYGAYPLLQTDFQKIFDTNLVGTINLVRACEKTKPECIINTSSSSEYGLVGKPMSEGDLPCPVNYYGATKTGATVFCQTHTRLTGAPIITTRLFSVYGAYEEPTRLVPSTIKKCLLNEKLEFTSGAQKRDFIHTTDVENAYLELVRRPELKGEVLNIGTGRQYTIREMVEYIVRETGTKQKPLWGAVPTRENEAMNWVADTSKASRMLKWRAGISLKDGVAKTVEWMKGNLEFYDGKGKGGKNA